MQFLKTSFGSSQCQPILMGLRAAFIHATTASEAKKRSPWDSPYGKNSRQRKKAEAKRTLLRDVSFFSEYLFQVGCKNLHGGKKQNAQIWSDKNNKNYFDMKRFSKGRTRHKASTNHGSQVPEWVKSYRKKKRKEAGCRLYSSDSDGVEAMFEDSFGRNRFCFWSFGDSDDVQWRSSASQFKNKGNTNWKCRSKYEDSCAGEYNSAAIGSASDRTTLGLAAVGPLKLDDVKNAFRMCALRWHPDRHQGPSKLIAEEKFKHCGVAYKSLCDALATT